MASCYEFEGKAVEDAVQKASESLNIPKGKLKYNIISHGSSGIFGIVGVKKAKISVALPKDAKPNQERRPKNRHQSVPSTETEERCDAKDDPLEIDTAESVTSLVREAFELDESPSTPAKTDRPFIAEDHKPAIDIGHKVLQQIIDFITNGAEITVEEMEDRVLFNVQGGNAGVLIGKRGQTLEAIQYIVEKIVNKNNGERIRIQVDVEGYLDNRRANLEELAQKLAERTKTTGRPSTMGQMNAHDRRIVHLALKDETDVRTQSIGDGFYRKLVIFPKKNQPRRKRPASRQ